jgi:predicted DNA-binding WGR domain protein
VVLYELEEGTSRKFYRIELVGLRVELWWSRIGSTGQDAFGHR